MPKLLTPDGFLTASFYDSAMVWARFRARNGERPCWLSDHDPRRRPCSTEIQGIHLVNKQRVREALFALWPDEPCPGCDGLGWPGPEQACALCGGAGDTLASYGRRGEHPGTRFASWRELAEWDPRLAAPGCTNHHPRFDHHLGPELVIPSTGAPRRLRRFGEDWHLEHVVDERFPEAVPA